VRPPIETSGLSPKSSTRSTSFCSQTRLLRILHRIALCVSIPALLVCAGATPAKRKVTLASRLGLVVQKSGPICLYTHNADLSDGSALTLVLVSPPQSTIRAEVVRPASAASCPSIDPSDVTLSPYEIRALADELVRSMPVIAVSGPAGPFRKDGKYIAGDINQDGKSEYFRACTSGEGVHLTVWAGQALRGKPKWHQYYYLGYDVESSCTPSETQGP
jgi:hypothetical protein